MIIEKDTTIYFDSLVENSEPLEQMEFRAFCTPEQDVFLAPDTVPNLFRNYFHEAGHVIGEILSFGQGQVLSPKQTKNVSVSLTDQEKSFLLTKFIQADLKTTTELSEVQLGICQKILTSFTHNNFNPEDIKIHKISSVDKLQELFIAKMLEEGNNCTTALSNEGVLIPISTSEGRDIELSAMVTQFGCLQILENCLKINFPELHITHIGVQSIEGSHQRAQNIVHYAYRENLVLPSIFDLEQS